MTLEEILQWMIERRIACPGYPASEASFMTIDDYITEILDQYRYENNMALEE